MDGIRRASLSCTAFLCCVVFLCIAYFSGVRVNLSGYLPHRFYRIAVLSRGKPSPVESSSCRTTEKSTIRPLPDYAAEGTTPPHSTGTRSLPKPNKMTCPPTRCFFNIHALFRSCRPAYDASGLRIRTPQNAGPGRFFQYNYELNFTIDIFYKLCYSLLQLSATQRWLGKHWGCRLRKDDK